MKIFVTVFDDVDLLPHFFQHYTQEGYTHILVGLSQAPGSVTEEEVESHCKVARSNGILVTLDRYGNSNTLQNADLDQQWTATARAAWCGPDEWHGIADLDEHHVYPGGLRNTITQAEAAGADYVSGYMVDQVAADGSLPAVPHLPVSLAETFPAARRITGTILGGTTDKVCLVRGQIVVGSGHHFADEGKVLPQTITVSHYKWHAQVLRRLRLRLKDYQGQNLHYIGETERILDYLDRHGSFDMADPALMF